MNDVILTEFLPIDTAKLPKLFAYRLTIGEKNNTNTIGGKLSYRLRKSFQGNWVWTNFKIISDCEKTEAELQDVLQGLWQEEAALFTHLHKITPYTNWQSTPQEIADFFSKGVLANCQYQIRDILRSEKQDIGRAYVERDYEIRGWVVNGEPAVSVSISSNLIYKKDVKAYANTLKDPQELVDIWVFVKGQGFKGKIVDVVGTMKDHRQRLLATSKSDQIQSFLQNVPDDELVVKIQAGQNGYDYPVSALNVILLTGYLSKFGVNARTAVNAFRLAPELRHKIIQKVLQQLHATNGTFYSSQTHPELFLSNKDVGFTPQIQVGGNQVCVAEEKKILQHLQKYGLYKRHTNTISMGLIDARPSAPKTTFGQEIKETLSKLKIDLKFVGSERVETLSRLGFETAINKLQEKNPDVIVAILPDNAGHDEDGENWLYGHFKSLTVGRNIASQVIYHSTLTKQFAVGNVALGILGKTGNIPFVLANPLPYADLVVGIDVAREKKRNLTGSMSATAIARIYFNNGDFLQYVIHDAPLEGETIPEKVLHSLFPVDEFRGKRVVVHRDGFFRGNEKRALHQWAENLGATFHLVEIIKSGAPRIYCEHGNAIQQPPKGTVFKLNDYEALLVSSLPPFKTATPQPLHVRAVAPFPIEQAIHSILSLTLLHYGSLRQPKLPVTVHYSDKIGYLALRGIKPKNLEGNIPFWL